MAQTIGSLDLNAFSDLYNDSTQYFWFESDSTATYGAGVHITLSPSATFMSNPTGQNILINTDGISIRNGLLPMMTLDNDSLDFNVIDTLNNTFTNVASFGAITRVGEQNSSRTEITPKMFSVITQDGFRALDVLTEGESLTRWVSKHFYLYSDNTDIVGGQPVVLAFAQPTQNVQISCYVNTNTSDMSFVLFTFNSQTNSSGQVTYRDMTITYSIVWNENIGTLTIQRTDGSGGMGTLWVRADNISWQETYTIPKISIDGKTQIGNDVAINGALSINSSDLTGMSFSINGHYPFLPALSATGLTPYSSRCTILGGGTWWFGSWAFVQLRLRINASLSANNYWGILDGLPMEDEDMSAEPVALSAAVVGKNGGAISSYVNTEGRLVLVTDNASLASGDVVVVTGLYYPTSLSV